MAMKQSAPILMKVAQRGVDADERSRPDLAVARDDDVRGEIDVILDDRTVPDMIATPEINIVPEPTGWLHGLIFQDETVFSHD